MARVLVLSNHYPPHSYGGYELACFDAVNRWRSRGHDVAVLTSDHTVNGTESDAQDEVAIWRQLPMTWLQGSPPAKWRRPFVERHAQQTLRNAIARFAPDVISVWNMAGLPLSLLSTVVGRRLPTVAVIADAWPARAPENDPWIRPLAGRPLLARAVGALTRLPTGIPDLDPAMEFVFVSESIRESCREQSPFRFPSSVIVPLGVNLEEFPLVAPHARPWANRLLFVGRLDESKGIDTAVRAMAHIPEAITLDVFGPPEPIHLARLHRLTEAAGVGPRVRFRSAPRAELLNQYRAADVVVFPSEWREPFGIVPLEAMASGAVVVATGVGGSGDYLVDGENCVLFEAGDATALAAAVARVAGDAALRERLIDGGLATAARLTIAATADRLEQLHLETARAGHNTNVR